MGTYLVFAPEPIRGIYDTWAECEAKLRGVSGAVYRKTRTREEAEALLRGEGRRLAPGTYAFVDGNHEGGIGIVFVHRRQNGGTRSKEIATRVADVLPEVAGALPRLRNVLAELVAVVGAMKALKPETTVSVVHDYEGTGHFLTNRWQARHPGLRTAISTALGLIEDRQLNIRFMHVNSHQSAIGGDEFAAFNRWADRLARKAVDNANSAV
jgi:ribonuclease HI